MSNVAPEARGAIIGHAPRRPFPPPLFLPAPPRAGLCPPRGTPRRLGAHGPVAAPPARARTRPARQPGPGLPASPRARECSFATVMASVALDAERLIAWRTLQIVVGAPYLPGSGSCGRFIPALRVGHGPHRAAAGPGRRGAGARRMCGRAGCRSPATWIDVRAARRLWLTRRPGVVRRLGLAHDSGLCSHSTSLRSSPSVNSSAGSPPSSASTAKSWPARRRAGARHLAPRLAGLPGGRLAARRIEIAVDDGDDSVTTLRERRGQTIAQLLRSMGRVAIVAIALLLTFNVFIDIGPILAGAGILGLAVSFGAQSLVKDVISGFFILFENQFAIGDVIEVGGKERRGREDDPARGPAPRRRGRSCTWCPTARSRW